MVINCDATVGWVYCPNHVSRVTLPFASSIPSVILVRAFRTRSSEKSLCLHMKSTTAWMSGSFHFSL